MSSSESEYQLIEEWIVRVMTRKGLTLSTAESCTGGMIASRIVSVPGSSLVLQAGLVTYTNEMKHQLLGVPLETLEQFTAVSKETAYEMAKGGYERLKTDLCISVTGLAGPGGATEEQPVGLVFIGCCVCGKTTVNRFVFSGNRNEIRTQATEAALSIVKDQILQYPSS